MEYLPDETLLNFFKALADANRLKLLGLLAGGEYTVEQLAEILHLRASTVSHHLSKLAEVGLVSARAESYYNYYRLQPGELEKMAHRLLSPETLPAIAAGIDRSAYDHKVVADYTLPGGGLKTIPAQRKKLEVLLRHIVRDFEPGVRYSEKQVNAALARYHEDTATLRRELVGYRLLARQAGEYWRVEEERGIEGAGEQG